MDKAQARLAKAAGLFPATSAKWWAALKKAEAEGLSIQELEELTLEEMDSRHLAAAYNLLGHNAQAADPSIAIILASKAALALLTQNNSDIRTHGNFAAHELLPKDELEDIICGPDTILNTSEVDGMMNILRYTTSSGPK